MIPYIASLVVFSCGVSKSPTLLAFSNMFLPLRHITLLKDLKHFLYGSVFTQLESV